MTPRTPIDPELIAKHNARLEKDLAADYEHLGVVLSRRGVDLEKITGRIQRFAVAIPSWGVGSGGTRFARFPVAGEPRNVFEKLEDCAVIQQWASTSSLNTKKIWNVSVRRHRVHRISRANRESPSAKRVRGWSLRRDKSAVRRRRNRCASTRRFRDAVTGGKSDQLRPRFRPA